MYNLWLKQAKRCLFLVVTTEIHANMQAFSVFYKQKHKIIRLKLIIRQYVMSWLPTQ